MTNPTAWIIAGAALVAALALLMRLRTAAAALQSTRELAESLSETLAERTGVLEKAKAKNARHAEEMAELRKKLEKAKRRASGQATGHGAQTDQTAALEAELEQVRQARDAARDEASGLAAELSRLRAARAEAPTPTPAPAPAPAAPPPRLDDAAIDALEARVSRAESAAGEAKAALSAERTKTARLKAKVSNQELLYASIRSELEAKKDRLKTQQEEVERLRALKAALGDATPTVEPTPASGFEEAEQAE